MTETKIKRGPGRPSKSKSAAPALTGSFPEGSSTMPPGVSAEQQSPDVEAIAAAPDAVAPVVYMLQPQIAGYRYVDERTAARMNVVKGQARLTRELCEDVERWGGTPDDIRQARELLRLGYSLLVRAIAKPTEW